MPISKQWKKSINQSIKVYERQVLVYDPLPVFATMVSWKEKKNLQDNK